MKLIYVVIDGLGDLPIKELDYKTPLEKANTPNLDFLASQGKLGLMYTVGKGFAPESDVAVISILGYDPLKYYVRRGPIEAFGAGVPVKNGDLALRCNYASINDKGLIIDRRVGRSLKDHEAKELTDFLNIELKLETHPADFELRSTIGHRCTLVIRSVKTDLSGEISNTDPAYERVGNIGVAKKDSKMMLQKSIPLDNTTQAKISSNLLNEFTEKSHFMLDKHALNFRRFSEEKLKANLILSRDAGNKLPEFFNISQHYGVKFACLADMPVERGISQLAGMNLINLPQPSKDLASDSQIRSEKIINLLPLYDCFYIHLKGPDEPAHDGNFDLKKKMIEKIDKFFIGDLISKVEDSDILMCVTADHSTPCEIEAHSDDPVPLLISGKTIKSDGINFFSEKACRKGSLGILSRGTKLMPLLMKIIS